MSIKKIIPRKFIIGNRRI